MRVTSERAYGRTYRTIDEIVWDEIIVSNEDGWHHVHSTGAGKCGQEEAPRRLDDIRKSFPEVFRSIFDVMPLVIPAVQEEFGFLLLI